MNELECLDSATVQLDEVRTAITTGDYSSLQGLLLSQTVILHKLGVELIAKSTEQGTVRHRCAYVDVALRALGQSQKAMGAIKSLQGGAKTS
jgi:hypothetical protein